MKTKEKKYQIIFNVSRTNTENQWWTICLMIFGRFISNEVAWDIGTRYYSNHQQFYSRKNVFDFFHVKTSSSLEASSFTNKLKRESLNFQFDFDENVIISAGQIMYGMPNSILDCLLAQQYDTMRGWMRAFTIGDMAWRRNNGIMSRNHKIIIIESFHELKILNVFYDSPMRTSMLHAF